MSFRDEELAERDARIAQRDLTIKQLQENIASLKRKIGRSTLVSNILRRINMSRTVIASIAVIVLILGYCFGIGASYSYLTKNCNDCHEGYGVASVIWPISVPVTIGARWSDPDDIEK
jgi:hypothetical protein